MESANASRKGQRVNFTARNSLAGASCWYELHSALLNSPAKDNKLPKRHRPTFTFAVVLITGMSVSHLAAQNPPGNPDFTRGDRIPQGANHDWNLGPTGARGWIYGNRLETTEARQILITKVDKESPADSVLQVGDVILGVAKSRFAFDPRTELGKAISAAEATDGTLALIRWRNGHVDKATLKLGVLGSYSATAPFECAKSQQILEQGCAALAKRMKANPDERNGIVRSLNTLALIASGRDEYMPIIEEQVKWAATYSDVEGRSLCAWYYGPINMLLAEYTLATGDKSHMSDLKRITMEIVHGQSAVGSWGHRFARPDGRLNGYGMMNAPGLPLTVSLILAREAGVRDPELDSAIEKSSRLMRFYVGKGCVPYGDHHPWLETHDDNGKNGIAALMFNLLGDAEAAEYFSRMSIASHGGERELGHTGNFFNILWAMPGVALSGPNASGVWMQEFGWYYDLGRRWNGTFLHQGPPAAKADSYENWDATGAYLLAYAQPLRKLFITGKKRDVVAQIDRTTAAGLIDDGRGYSHRLKNEVYSERSDEELLKAVQSWSPVVRDRAAKALSRRQRNFVPQLTTLLTSADLHSQLGACQALTALQKRSRPAVPELRKALKSDDLWLRIKAADALAGIGDAARPAVPDLLSMLVQEDREADPRGMQQRFLCFALFDRRDGLLKGSLDRVDQEALYKAVRAGLGNEDGRARGALATVYKKLSYEGIEPLLPAIHRAVVEPAPSGMMFADGVRLSGLEILAQHKIKEAMPLCLEVMELDRWGSKKRIPQCLSALQIYGAAAAGFVPELRTLEGQFKDDKLDKLLQQTINTITSDLKPPELRSLPLEQK